MHVYILEISFYKSYCKTWYDFYDFEYCFICIRNLKASTLDIRIVVFLNPEIKILK